MVKHISINSPISQNVSCNINARTPKGREITEPTISMLERDATKRAIVAMINFPASGFACEPIEYQYLFNCWICPKRVLKDQRTV